MTKYINITYSKSHCETLAQIEEGKDPQEALINWTSSVMFEIFQSIRISTRATKEWREAHMTKADKRKVKAREKLPAKLNKLVKEYEEQIDLGQRVEAVNIIKDLKCLL